ncbi:7188_t:CDS:2 [Funneliformis mosseae]|uniref:7188_t:CDS:1 n=1 Tax=Funneliformis mosseae TaxID=27381 RepID=A0A9N9CA38_FUNMO|nr:7188_t:CDS:2 [Funneliformis mosseae]
MAKAEWNGEYIYFFNFPANSIKSEFFQISSHHTLCPKKGEASYYNIDDNGIYYYEDE